MPGLLGRGIMLPALHAPFITRPRLEPGSKKPERSRAECGAVQGGWLRARGPLASPVVESDLTAPFVSQMGM